MYADVHRIVEADFKKNHQGRAYDKEFVHSLIDKTISLGTPYFVSINVLIVYNGDNRILEFHCINGGNGADLTGAINQFLTEQSANFDRAVTYYDNPRINELLKFSKYPAHIEKIDDGEDRTYGMFFDLRGA